MSTKKEVLLENGEVLIRTITDNKIGSQEKLFRDFMGGIPFDIPNAFLLPDKTTVNLQCAGASVVAWMEITKLQLSTVWTITDGGVRYPTFKKPHNMVSPPEHEASHPISPVKFGMRMFFVNQMQWNDAEKVFAWLHSYLVCRCSKRKEIFHPPLPNVHTDGKLCMGTYHDHNPILADLILSGYNHFNSSKWNTDLSEGLNVDIIKAIYSINGGEQVAPPDGFKIHEQRFCAPISVSVYSSLPIPTY